MSVVNTLLVFPLLDAYMRSVANGDKGLGPQKVYLWAQGKKTALGVFLALITVPILTTGYITVGVSIASIAYILVRVGVVDKDWRTVPASWEQMWPFRAVRLLAAPIALGIGYLTLRYDTCSPEVATRLAQIHVGSHHLTCHVMWLIVVGLGGEFMWSTCSARIADAPSGKGFVLQILQQGDQQ